MDENQIKALFQRHTRAQDVLLNDARMVDDIVDVVSRHGWPADQETPLDRVAASAAASEIAGVLAALDADIRTLERDVQEARTVPQRASLAFGRRCLRGGLALAAGVAALALLVTQLPGSQDAVAPASEMAMEEPQDMVIMAVSFESADLDSLAQQSGKTGDRIFGANFGS